MRREYVFFDIDTQHDFMDGDGALPVPGAVLIRENLEKLTDAAVRLGILVIASEDAHDADDPEFNDFPPHCVKGSRGAMKITETRTDAAVRVEADGIIPGGANAALDAPQVVLEKRTFDVFTNPAADALLDVLPEATAVIYGVATEYCVKAATRALLERGRNVIVVEDAVRGVSEEGHQNTLADLAATGARLLDTESFLNELEERRPVH